ncbi:MAG: hypothetical protein K1X88_29950 [Nannocystaceae bacterium]|nr:hypothetical protein [Nannocystaceae bacterium]
MRCSGWVCAMVLLGCVARDDGAGGSSTGPAGSSSDASSGGAAPLSCVAPGEVDFDLALQPAPPETGLPDTVEFHGLCTVAAVTDAPVSLALDCMQDGEPLAFSLSAAPLGATGLAQRFEPGASVELDYLIRREPSRPAAFASLRLAADSMPRVVAVASPSPMPWFGDELGMLEPFSLESVGATDCEPTSGSCGVGPRRRAAVRVSIDGHESITIFDRDEGIIAGYRVLVGEAIADEGNCEGYSETYDQVLILADPL